MIESQTILGPASCSSHCVSLKLLKWVLEKIFVGRGYWKLVSYFGVPKCKLNILGGICYKILPSCDFSLLLLALKILFKFGKLCLEIPTWSCINCLSCKQCLQISWTIEYLACPPLGLFPTWISKRGPQAVLLQSPTKQGRIVHAVETAVDSKRIYLL